MALVLGLIFGGITLSWAQEDAKTKAYVVQKGDTLSKIAKRFYGKSNLGSRLWRANQNVVAHPNRLTPGDVIYLFPESVLALNSPVSVPPPPENEPTDITIKKEPMEMSFPKYFSFVTDLQSHGHGTRITVKKIIPKTETRTNPVTGAIEEVVHKTYVDEIFEARIIGEIISSLERGPTIRNDGFSASVVGRTLLSTGDNVVVRFNEDLRKILDADSYEDPDPYFTTFPIYAISEVIQEPDRKSPSYGRSLGNLMYFRGKLTIVSRVEGIAPPPPMDVRRAKARNQSNSDLESVTYVARITYSEDAIHFGDKVLVFVPQKPGPERRLDTPGVEAADSYRAPGR
jgi:hypothetical protein